jgi:hypothetical protein
MAGQVDYEPRLAAAGRGGDGAAVRFGDRACDRQAQTRIAGLSGSGFVCANEPFEQVWKEVVVDAGTVVGDGQFRHDGAIIGSTSGDSRDGLVEPSAVAAPPRPRSPRRRATTRGRVPTPSHR